VSRRPGVLCRAVRDKLHDTWTGSVRVKLCEPAERSAQLWRVRKRLWNHNVLTGSDTDGRLYSQDASATCQDWSSSVASGGRPRCGVSWPRAQLTHWISALNEGGCAPGATPPGQNSGESGTVGALGGYGAFYCFAVTP
jgi:hypothetical protein